MKQLSCRDTALKDVFALAIQSIEKRLVIEDEMLVACLLDPGQIKSNFVSVQLEKKKTTVKEILLKFMQKTVPESNQNVACTSINSPLVQENQDFGPAKRLRLEMLRELDTEESSNAISDRSTEHEIDKYHLLASSISKHEDVIQFWRQNKINLPNLFELARNILGLSLTSSFCEHAFSLSGALLNKRRSKLNPVRAQKQLFVSANYEFYASHRQI